MVHGQCHLVKKWHWQWIHTYNRGCFTEKKRRPNPLYNRISWRFAFPLWFTVATRGIPLRNNFIPG